MFLTPPPAGATSFGSDAEGEPPDETTPAFTAGPAAQNVSETACQIAGTANEDCDMFVVLVPDGATAPTTDEVIAGVDYGAVQLLDAGSVALTETVSGNVSLSGGTPAGAADAHAALRDAAGNKSATPTKVDVTFDGITVAVDTAVVAQGTTQTLSVTLEDTATAVQFYHGFVEIGNEGTPMGAGVDQGGGVWELADEFDPDVYENVAAVVTIGGVDHASGNTITLEVTSSFTARAIVGTNAGASSAHLSKSWEADFDFWTDYGGVCFWMHPYALPGAVRYALNWGYDNSDEGFTVRTNSSNVLLCRILHGAGGANINGSTLVLDTWVFVSVYAVDGTMYLRLDSTESGNRNDIPGAPVTFGVNLGANQTGSDGLDSYYRNLILLKGYSATPATALSDIRSDLDDIFALGEDVDASTISGLNATDIALILPCDEESDGTVQVDRLDISGNGYDFTDNNTAASADLPIP